MSDLFVKVHLGGAGSLRARSVAAYVRFRCWASDGGWTNREIAKSEIASDMGMTDWDVRKGLAEAKKLGWVASVASSRPGAPGVFVDPAQADPHEDVTRPHENPSCLVGRDSPAPMSMSPAPESIPPAPHEDVSRPREGFSRPHENPSRLWPSQEQVDQVDHKEQVESEERASDLSARRFVTEGHIAAIRAAGDRWEYQRTMGPRWTEALGECIADLNLDPDKIREALRLWDDGFRGEGPSEATPAASAIWFYQSRGWLRAALGIEAPKQAGRSRSTGTALSSAEEHHQRNARSVAARKRSEPERDPAEVEAEMRETVALFDGVSP